MGRSDVGQLAEHFSLAVRNGRAKRAPHPLYLAMARPIGPRARAHKLR